MGRSLDSTLRRGAAGGGSSGGTPTQHCGHPAQPMAWRHGPTFSCGCFVASAALAGGSEPLYTYGNRKPNLYEQRNTVA